MLTNVITVTTVETVSIRYLDLMDIFKTYKEIYQDIKVCLQEHLFANEAALLRKRGRLPEMIPAEKSLGQGDMFKYQIYDEAETRPEQEAYMKPFRRLGMHCMHGAHTLVQNVCIRRKMVLHTLLFHEENPEPQETFLHQLGTGQGGN